MSPLTRLYPWTRSRADRNSSREYSAELAQRAADSVPPGALVLDAGSNPGTPYYSGFGQYRHEFVDIQAESANITYMEQIPFCPQQVLREWHRVLEPGCGVWLNTPLLRRTRAAVRFLSIEPLDRLACFEKRVSVSEEAGRARRPLRRFLTRGMS